MPDTQIKSAALIVNAKSRKGQALFKRACSAMSGLPYDVDAHAVAKRAIWVSRAWRCFRIPSRAGGPRTVARRSIPTI